MHLQRPETVQMINVFSFVRWNVHGIIVTFNLLRLCCLGKNYESMLGLLTVKKAKNKPTDRAKSVYFPAVKVWLTGCGKGSHIVAGFGTLSTS